MEAAIECTHCRVVMTSWSAPGSPIRYYQCPFCQRTHSSLYGEVFRRRAGARVVETPSRAPATPATAAAPGIPMASPDDVRWARVKATASRWFARLEAESRRCATQEPPRARRGRTARGADLPELDASEVRAVAPAGARRKG